MTPPTPPTPLRVIGYVRVSTDEQAESGAGIGAQRHALDLAAAARGWQVVDVIADEGESGAKSPEKRPGLASALARIEAGDADALAVSKLDRLSRSVLDFAGLMARAQQHRWSLVVLDLGIDMTTPTGKFMANVFASIAEWEREIIGQRTKDALAVKRRQGVRLGRRSALPAKIGARIVHEREQGRSWRAIAAGLNEDGVPTPRNADGGWRLSHVQSAHSSTVNDREARDARKRVAA